MDVLLQLGEANAWKFCVKNHLLYDVRRFSGNINNNTEEFMFFEADIRQPLSILESYLVGRSELKPQVFRPPQLVLDFYDSRT